MKKKYAVILALCVILIAVILIQVGGKSASPTEDKIATGEKYLSERKYEEALLCFNEAIELEPMNVRAYLGATDSYIHLERQAEAVELLNTGFELTQNENLTNVVTGIEVSDIDGYIALAEAYKAEGLEEKANELLQRVYDETGDERLGVLLGLVEVVDVAKEETEIPEITFDIDGIVVGTSDIAEALSKYSGRADFRYVLTYPDGIRVESKNEIILNDGNKYSEYHFSQSDYSDGIYGMATYKEGFEFFGKYKIGDDAEIFLQDFKCIEFIDDGPGIYEIYSDDKRKIRLGVHDKSNITLANNYAQQEYIVVIDQDGLKAIIIISDNKIFGIRLSDRNAPLWKN